jgi:predicted nuclease of predicted toxin-antitoxin system
VRFLADESCDFAVVRALRNAGHDVLAVSEISPRADDAQILNFASQQERILITEDKDFGQLVFAHGKDTHGVIFLRYQPSARLKIAKEVVTLVKQRGAKLPGCFVVIQPGRIRISGTPGN